MLCVAAVVVFGLYTLLGRSSTSGTSPAPTATQNSTSPAGGPAYRCLTTADKLIPIKAVITRDGAEIHSDASTSSPIVTRAKSFAIYVALEKRDRFIELGNDPLSGTPVGWARRSDVLLWTTKEALRPNKANSARHPLQLWEAKSSIGNPQKVTYDERVDSDPLPPYPVLESDHGRYRIALTWQSEDYRDEGVATAWTDAVTVPDDVRFYYYMSREELRSAFEQLDQALLSLESGGSSEHPLVAFLRSHVRVTVGDQIDLRDDDLPLFRRILRNLRNPISIAEKQPADIKRDSERMKQDLRHLRDFYQNRDNWNAEGEGWLPREYLPGR